VFSCTICDQQHSSGAPVLDHCISIYYILEEMNLFPWRLNLTAPIQYTGAIRERTRRVDWLNARHSFVSK
jgi:hypothetical protein